MKRDPWNLAALVLGIVVLGAGGFAIVRAIRSASTEAPLAARAAQKIVTLEVRGAGCDGCADPVRAAIGAVPGVATVDLRPAQRRAYVVCARTVADSALTWAIARAGPGFSARVIQR